MPEYLMRCKNGHEQSVFQHMEPTAQIMCQKCEEPMWRKPQPVMVNWNGIRPSHGELHPEIKELVDTAPERRAVFEQEHEEHERWTA